MYFNTLNNIENKKCRVFIRDTEQMAWQLFSFEQNRHDGSIYLTSPEFTSFEWLTVELEGDILQPYKVTQDIEGHLSFHGHGQAHVKSNNEKYKLPIPGQYLLRVEQNNISFRHLFTLFPKKPEYIPTSVALNRKSDQIVHSSQPLVPFIISAYALPRLGLELDFQFSLSLDDMEGIPVLGTHLFPLIHHDIFLFFYKTKNMEVWPQKTMLQYLDGVHVPIFIGGEDKSLKVEVRLPGFKLEGNKLEIRL